MATIVEGGEWRSPPSEKLLYKKCWTFYAKSTESGKRVFFGEVYYGVKLIYSYQGINSYVPMKKSKSLQTDLNSVLTKEEFLFKKLKGEIDDEGYAVNPVHA